jgi:hypothetical protein
LPAQSCVIGQCRALTKYVFVTSAQYPASLGGLAGADSGCQALAKAAKLPGTYKAWLSDDTSSAAARLTHSTVPYVLSDGATVVASDWNQLTSGTLNHAIDLTERGNAPPTTSYCAPGASTVWTDTATTGAEYAVGNNCSNWTGGSSQAWLGGATFTNWEWTAYCSGSAFCSNAAIVASLYCVEQ